MKKPGLVLKFGGRDTGRQQAYRAESEALGHWTLPGQPRVSQQEAQEIADAIYGAPVEIRFGHFRNSVAWPFHGLMRIVTGWGGTVALQSVLHEVAHLLTPGCHHGEEWRTLYVQLIREWWSDEKADALAQAFRTQPLRRAPRAGRKSYRLFKVVAGQVLPVSRKETVEQVRLLQKPSAGMAGIVFRAWVGTAGGASSVCYVWLVKGSKAEQAAEQAQAERLQAADSKSE